MRRVSIFEADNRLVGFDIPTMHDLLKRPALRLLDYWDRYLYGAGIKKKQRRMAASAMPLQGPIFAANLLRKTYSENELQATVYVPGISEDAGTLYGVRHIIRHSDVVVVSALSVHAWAQKAIIRIAREENKKVIATGPHARMVEAAKSLLDKPGIPGSRHNDYNDRIDVFPGADYVIQHNHYDAFLMLIDLIRQGKDSPKTVKTIPGVGYHDMKGETQGLTADPCQVIVADIPDIPLDFRVIDGCTRRLKMIPLTGSEQGCINACQFCQIKLIMGNRFIYIPPGYLYGNLSHLHRTGVLKRGYNPLRGSLDNSVFFTDDSPVLGGPPETDIPFDYIEWTKTMDAIFMEKPKGKKTIFHLPPEGFEYLLKRNPAGLVRMDHLGMTYVLDTLPSRGKEDQPLRKNYIEFSRMLDEIEQFEWEYRYKPSFSIEMSVRAVNYLQALNPYTLPRMHRLGFDMIQVGFEDLIHTDNRGITGFAKSNREENRQAVDALKHAGLVIFAMLICSAENYELGDARQTAHKAMEMGIDCIQIFSEQVQDGTPAAKRHREHRRCLFQVADDYFGGEWRDLAYGLGKGEIVTLRPDKASMLGMQLDILDASVYYSKLSNHWTMFKEGWRAKGWRTSLYGVGLPALEVAALTRDLAHFLFHTPIRKGKSYIRLLAEIDPRWKHEAGTLALIRKFNIETLIEPAGSLDGCGHF
ncbi:MAG: hypothetical protein ACM3SY_06785 [Candidatus Omnitrophota bacterium]